MYFVILIILYILYYSNGIKIKKKKNAFVNFITFF